MSLCYGRPGGGQQGRRLQAGPAGLPQLGYHGTSDGLLLNAVAGAAPCLCEPLVGAANQIPHILPPAVFPVEHRQRVPALVTEKQPFQWKLIGSAAGVPPAGQQTPHPFKGLRRHQRLMGSLHHHPVLR